MVPSFISCVCRWLCENHFISQFHVALHVMKWILPTLQGLWGLSGIICTKHQHTVNLHYHLLMEMMLVRLGMLP
jgi:hypothetical protein